MRRFTISSIALLLIVASTSSAEAICGCPSGGVPRLQRALMSGNDLNEVRGDCTRPGMTVELQVRQQHFYRKSSLPLGLGGPFEGACINGCQWITIGSTQSDPVAGHFAFTNLDQSQSVQLLASQWSVIGLDGVRTDLRVRARLVAAIHQEVW